MSLMNRETGGQISDLDHVKQSIGDILTTRIGSRVYVRSYGSRLFDLIDLPFNRALVQELYGAVAEALDRWEPRVKLTKIELNASQLAQGIVVLAIEGLYLPNGQPIRLEGITISRSQG